MKTAKPATLWQKVGRTVASKRHAAPAPTPEKKPDFSEALAQAKRLSLDPKKVSEATVAYRNAVLASENTEYVVLGYARFLVAHSLLGQAEEVVGQALARNGAQPEMLEIYTRLTTDLKLPADRLAWALSRLQADIPEHPKAHRGALDFAIPHRQNEVLKTISESPVPLAKAAASIAMAYNDGNPQADDIATLTFELTPTEALQAHLIVTLGRGNRAASTDLLDKLPPDDIPLDSLRRAIKRAKVNKKTKQLAQYSKAYLRARPSDAWAQTLLSQSKTTEITNYQLGKSGFPFPKPAERSVYEPRRDHVFYLLHNSLPHNSAGYATRTHGLLSELNRIGWDVDGVTRLGYPYDMPGKDELPDIPAHETVGNVDYRRLLRGREIEKKNPLYSYTERYSTELRKLATEQRPAIIHAASNHWNGLTGVVTARKLGLPSIYEVRGLWEVTRGSRNPEWAKGNMFRYMARMEADAAKGATHVLAITNALKAEMVNRGVDADKITVVPNGVDTKRFTPIPRDEQLANELGVSGKTVIGYVGSVLDYEGIELMIEAARSMAKTRDDFHVLIVGDGAELERFQNYVSEHNLQQVVTFTGRVPHEEVERYYSLIDITPFPRLPLPVCEMVSPLKPFEAMAMGKAVVASDVAALSEIVTSDYNGLLHEKGSAESLTSQLEILLDNPEKRAQLGQQSRDWVVQERDWKILAERISQLYTELI